MIRPRLRRLPAPSYRTGVALGVLAAILGIVLVSQVLNAVIEHRAQAGLERTLQQQADAVALAVVRGGRERVATSLAEASNLLPDTRVVVRIGGVDQYWSRPSGDTYARAQATREWATVTLERVDPVSAVERWLVLVLAVAGVAAAALFAWLVAAVLAGRLQASLRRLVETADEVSHGHLDARAPETGDEVGRVASAFNRMTAHLQAADERQREFLADVAHELRTPVTAIEGFAAALEDGTARTEEDRREAAAFIRDEAARLRELVRDLQALTWLDLAPPVRREPADLAALARDGVGRLAADAASRGVTLRGPEGGPEGGVPVVTDREHVETILVNLITNALKATPPGGSVEVRVGADGGDAYLAVADTGVGIRQEHLPFLFDRLFRVDSSRVREDDAGSGLGLSIVKRLALMLDGRVTVTSAPGQGSTFTVWLLGAAARPAPARPVRAAR